MIRAKKYKNANIKKMQRYVLSSEYEYGLFTISMPLKLSQKNTSNYTAYINNKEIGLILNNNSVLNTKNSNVIFDKRKALSKTFYENIIINLNKPIDKEYTKWLSILEKFIIPLNVTAILLPLDNSYNTNLLSQCNLLIQEMNAILLPYAMATDIIILQRNEPLSSLSYILQNMGYPSKISLCLNIDSMEQKKYSLTDIKDEVIKFNIKNSISMIETNNYDAKSKDFNEFINFFNEDVIVFGNKI